MESFRFANPHMLWMLVLVVALTALFIVARLTSHRALKRFGNLALLKPLMPGVSEGKLRIKFAILMLALTSMIIAAARPQFGSKLETVKKQGIEVMCCLDISNSMLAEDISPNRLERAKRMLSRLLDNLDNDQVGLIVFAGEAYTQLPITNDFVSAKMFLSNIDPKMVSLQGTAIGAAINLAVRSFTPREESEKAIILITDGENHEDDATGAAKAAFEKGIRTHVIGIGSTQGALLPDESGRPGSYRKDKAGNPVTTRLDEKLAQELAAAGQGIYAHADNGNGAIQAVTEALSKMQTAELESHVYADYDDKFMAFVWLAFILLFINMFILDTENKLLAKVNLFKAMAFIVVLSAASAQTASAQKVVRQNIREGNSQYENNDFLNAEISYRKALETAPQDSLAMFNLGNALFRQQDNEKAQEAMQQYLTTAQNCEKTDRRDLASKAYYNAGDICMAAQQYDKAVQLFKRSLRNNPADDEARYNLYLAQKLLQQQQQDQQNQDQDQQQDQQQQKQDQQQQQQQNQQQQEQQQQEQQQQPQQQQMSQEQAEAILNANNRDEKETQEKVQKAQMQQMQRRKSDKDW